MRDTCTNHFEPQRFDQVGRGALWANRVSYENAKGSKKLRPIAQNSGHVARRPEVSIEIPLS